MAKRTKPRRWDFFLAYAGPDEAQAEALFDLLAAGKVEVFLASKRVKLGDDWDAGLAAAQQRSQVTVVLVSRKSNKAYYEREEIAAAIAMARADKTRHRVVPLYLDPNAKPPYGLRLKHGIKIADGVGLAEAAEKLLALLRDGGGTAPKRGRTKTANAPASRAAPSAGNGIVHQPGPKWVSPVRRNRFRFKVAAFDFDGTLLRGKNYDFSWDVVWRGLGFSKTVQSDLKRVYRQQADAAKTPAARLAAYAEWCNGAVGHFRSRNVTRDQLRAFAGKLHLTKKCREGLKTLREEGVVIAIVSGGIDTFLADAFPDFRDHTDFVFINELTFAASGELLGVRPSHYDFQGKAEALELVCRRVGCDPSEAVFVGDHFNDESVMTRVGRAIAYPPKDRVVEDAMYASVKVDDLTKVLPHILVE